MNLVQAVTAIRLNQDPQVSFADPSEQLVLDYVRAVHRLTIAGSTQISFAESDAPAAEISLAKDCFHAWETAERDLVDAMDFLTKNSLIDKAELSPGPFEFWKIEVLSRYGMTFSSAGQIDEALTFLRRALPLALRQGFFIRSATLLGYICFGLNLRADYLGIRESLAQLNDLTTKVPGSVSEVIWRAWQGYMLMLSGRYPESLEQLTKSQAVLRQIQLQNGLLDNVLSRAQVYFRWGRLERIEELIQESADLILNLNVRSSLKEQACLIRAQLYVQTGKSAQAAEQLETVATKGLDTNLYSLYLRTHCDIAKQTGRPLESELHKLALEFLGANADSDWRIGPALWSQQLLTEGVSPELTAAVAKFEQRSVLADLPWEILLVRIHQLDVAVLTEGHDAITKRFSRLIEFAREKDMRWSEFVYLELWADYLKFQDRAVGKDVSRRLKDLKDVNVPHQPLRDSWPYKNLWQKSEIPRLDFIWEQGLILTDYNRSVPLPPPGPAFQFLRALANSRNQTVRYEELTREIWPGEIYSPTTHNARIHKIAENVREHFRAGGLSERSLVTVAGTGYHLRSK